MLWPAIYLTICVIFAAVVWWWPWLLLRPSVWVGCTFLVFICPAAAFLPDTWIYEGAWFSLGDYRHIELLRLLTLLFPTAILLIAGLSLPFNGMTRKIYLRCTGRSTPGAAPASTPAKWRIRLSWILAATALLVAVMSVGLYLRQVPLSSTGLYAVIFDPARSDVAREESMTDVASMTVRYSYSWHAVVFAPLLVVFLRLWAWGRRWRAIVAYGIGMPAVALSAMLPGNRSALATILVALALSFFLTSGVKALARIVIVSVCAVLLVVALTSIAREGRWQEISPAMVYKYALEKAGMRVFGGPFYTGVVTNAYADWHGVTGGASIRPLAVVCGVDYLQLPPIVGEIFIGRGASMNTSFLFDFQAAFGLKAGFAVALVAVFMLDGLLFAYLFLPRVPLVALLSVQLTTLFALFSSAFFVSILSNGIVVPALLAVFVNFFSQCAPAPAIPSCLQPNEQ